MDIVTLGAALNGSAEYVNSHFKGGSNIQIVDNPDGTQTINASGEVSFEDTVARAEIAAIKDGETLDSFGDVETALIGKADTTDIPTVPITTIQKNGTGITPVSGTVNITVPTSAADVSALPDTTKYAAALSLTINSSTFVMTGQLKDQNGDNLGTAQTIDLPLESVVVNGSYNSQTKKVVLTLQSGNTIEFSVADLVSGLQTELSASNKLNPAYINYDSTHKLSADLVDDTSTTNKFATAEELEQIPTNKNNILTVANQSTKYNLSPVASGTASGAGFIIANTAANIPQGDYYFCWTGTADTNGTTINIYQQDDSRIVNQLESNSAGEMIAPVNVPANGAKFNLYTTVANNITNLRIIPKNVYDSGFTAYQPYAMSNAEITAWILSHS